MTAHLRPRGDESVADIGHVAFGDRLAAEAVAQTAVDELLADLQQRPEHHRLPALLEVLGRLIVLAPAAVTTAVANTREGLA